MTYTHKHTHTHTHNTHTYRARARERERDLQLMFSEKRPRRFRVDARRHALPERGVKQAAAQAAALLEEELLRDNETAEVGSVQGVSAVEAQQRFLPPFKCRLAAAQRCQRSARGAHYEARRKVSVFKRRAQAIPQATNCAVETNLLLEAVPVEIAHCELQIYATLC
jgi:hypothetical protein